MSLLHADFSFNAFMLILNTDDKKKKKKMNMLIKIIKIGFVLEFYLLDHFQLHGISSS